MMWVLGLVRIVILATKTEWIVHVCFLTLSRVVDQVNQECDKTCSQNPSTYCCNLVKLCPRCIFCWIIINSSWHSLKSKQVLGIEYLYRTPQHSNKVNVCKFFTVHSSSN